MKTRIALIFVFLMAMTKIYGQDRIVMINGDELSGKVSKYSAESISLIESGDIERSINANFVNQVNFANGKRADFTIPKSIGLEYDNNFVVLVDRSGIEDEIMKTFPGSVRREFTVTINNKNGDVSNALFINTDKDKYVSLSKQQKDAIAYFRFLGYSCNSFTSVVSISGNNCRYVFFSKGIAGDHIRSLITNKTYRLIDSKAGSGILNFIDNSLKPFTMKFNNDGTCVFKQDGEEKVLNYETRSDGSMAYWDQGKKKEKATIYDVVFINDTEMRYTQFSQGNKDLITRKISVVNSL